MSKKYIMMCNMVAWKEGDEYVFEDGSKAYKFPDNDRRFKNYTLIPSWVVEGLVDTHYTTFGIKGNKIYVEGIGYIARDSFCTTMMQYKCNNGIKATDIKPLFNVEIFNKRTFYYWGYLPCRIKDIGQSKGIFVEFIDSGKECRCRKQDLFEYTEYSDIVESLGSVYKIKEIFLPKNRNTQMSVKFIAEDGREFISSGQRLFNKSFYPDDIYKAATSCSIRLKKYFYSGKAWYVDSVFGTLTHEKFIKKCEEYKVVRGTFGNKVFLSENGIRYRTLGYNVIQYKKGTLAYDAVIGHTTKFRNIKDIDIFLDSVTISKFTRSIVSKEDSINRLRHEWAMSIVGLPFKITGTKYSGKKTLYEIMFENGDKIYATWHRVKMYKVCPSFLRLGGKLCDICYYGDIEIRSLYFDYKDNIYCLLSGGNEILKVDRDGNFIGRLENE